MAVMFSSNKSGQSLSTAENTITAGVERALRADFEGAQIVGIIASTDWSLIQSWQACLNQGRTPIILHYPTPKLSRLYWQTEISTAAATSGISLLICQDASCVPAGLDLPVMLLDKVHSERESEKPVIPLTGSIIQMSSGTTGHRKGIAFRIQDICDHIEKYNEVLKLTPDDCVVSWLPLYHDMGFVAAFLMPRLLGCKLVMIDPIAWVKRPELLYDMSEQHSGTVCYMPNFGFELMAARSRPLRTIRKWISCSEPTRRATMERFIRAVGCDAGQIYNCWGMAENIFAVTWQQGLASRFIGGSEVMSCGKPIAGVDVKEVDGEIYVRSDYSIKEYIGFPLELDQDGFYATGDLGLIIDENVYLQGRKIDIINIAGRKTIASDIDVAVAEEFPDAAGRIATFAVFDAALGTDLPVVLIEDPEFWEKDRDAHLRRRIMGRIGVESARVHFVPPKFITKTSSGKINRKATRENWLKALEARRSDSKPFAVDQIKNSIAEVFPWLDFAVPTVDQMDSLGIVNLALLLERYDLGNRFAPEAPLDEVLNYGNLVEPARSDNVIKIVSLADSNVFRTFAPEALNLVGQQLDLPIQFKHVCAPAISVLNSDLVFADYFLCRDNRGSGSYESFLAVLDDLRSASVLVVDDSATVLWPYTGEVMVYPQLSHDFNRDPESELIGVRWARYSEGHHQVACKAVQFEENEISEVNAAISRLSSYLKIPVVRVSYGPTYSAVTREWEVRGDSANVGDVTVFGKFENFDKAAMARELAAALIHGLRLAPQRASSEGTYENWSDQPHWCSWEVNPKFVDFILERYERPVVLGKPSSAPYLQRMASQLGVELSFRSDLFVPEACDCVIMNGAWGRPETDKPIFQLMAAGWGDGTPINVPDEVSRACPPNRLPRRSRRPSRL